MVYQCAGYIITFPQVLELAYKIKKVAVPGNDIGAAWCIAFDELYAKYSADLLVIASDRGEEDLAMIVILEAEGPSGGLQPLNIKDLTTNEKASAIRAWFERIGLKPYKTGLRTFDSYPG